MDLEQIRSDWDAAKRASDCVSLHLAADYFNAIGRWVALRLSDGNSDDVLYDSKQDAVRHQLHEYQCAYLVITPDGLPVKAAFSYLKVNRMLYDVGMRMTDPEAHTAQLAMRGKFSKCPPR